MINLYILVTAFLSLLIGILIYLWLNCRKDVKHFHANNLICWLLIALFPVLLIFSFFPTSFISGNIKGVSMGGAIAAFIFIWWYGTRSALQSNKIDVLNVRIQELESELLETKSILEKVQEPPIPSRLREREIFTYKFKGAHHKIVGFVTGLIQEVDFVDIWVNSENTNMEMARYYDRSISGAIRYLGAKKNLAGDVIEDTIFDELSQIMGNNKNVQPATVLVTGPGESYKTNNVKKIFHVAAVHGEVGHGYRPINNIELCVSNSLKKVDSQELQELELKSIIFPLMGTGTAKGDLKSIAKRLIHAAISYIETNENSSLDCIYFLTPSDFALETCKAILEESNKFVALTKP